MKGSSLFLSFFFIFIFTNFSNGQTASVKFEVKVSQDGMRKNASVFLSGSFNCWNPHDSLYLMKKTGDNLYSLVVPLFDGKKYEYNYTQGSWSSVETAAGGREIKNRQMISQDGLTILDTVKQWKPIQTAKRQDTTFKMNKKQMEALLKLKEDFGKKLESRKKNLLIVLKKAMDNMLANKPSMRLRKKYHKEAVEEINYDLKLAADLMWKVSSILTPEQKQAIRDKMNNSASKLDVFGLLFGAFSQAKK